MQIESFQNALLAWYFANERNLPWRENHDPYRIWLSEVMLQQTQVVTVIDYFNQFTSVYPTIFSLAKASEDEVFKLWEGLGYYSRARNLMKCAKFVVSEYQGIFPNDLDLMLKLPGIGPYTAGAILSIAYNAPVPAVDGNVLRVISRLYESYEDISNPKTRPLIEKIIYELLPEDRRHFNQAIMELGATICTPKNPSCHSCPVSTDCKSFKNQTVSLIPVKLKKQKKTEFTVPVGYLTYKNQILLIKRDGIGLLSGLWGFPAIELEQGATPDLEQQALIDWFSEYLDVSVTLAAPLPLGHVKHVFTHKVWHLSLWHFKTETQAFVDFPQMEWVTREAIKDFALPTAFVKLIQKSEKGQLSK